MSSAKKSCFEYHEDSIIGYLAPDGLELFDDNPYNDPYWVEPEISFISDTIETDKKLILDLKASIDGDEIYHGQCTYIKVDGFFWDKYQESEKDGDFVTTTTKINEWFT